MLHIHAELGLDRITPVLAGWLRKLEPLGHGNPEPIFVARKARLTASPRLMKERHIRLELAHESDLSPIQFRAPSGSRTASTGVVRRWAGTWPSAQRSWL